MTNVLVLCHGNINRSPLCAAVLGYHGINVKSAGFVGPNKRASKKMRDAASPKGYSLSGHRSQLLTPELMEWADLVVYMDNGNHKRLKAFEEEHPVASRVKWVCLGSYACRPRVPDPAFMRRGSQEFKETVELIIKASGALAMEILAKS